MLSNLSNLFSTINKVKDLGSYSVANLAFSCLLDLSLDAEKELQFIWEKSPGNDDDDIYYDLLVISDGIRRVCLPAPLLKKPLVWRDLCNKEVEREEHNRSVKEWILGVQDYESYVDYLKQGILDIFPNALELKEKYLSPSPSRNLHDEKKEFRRKVDIAKNTTYAKVEATGEIRSVYLCPELGFSSFPEVDWDSYRYTIGGSINNLQWVVKSDGNPQWIWYGVDRQLPTLKSGESRWLIYKGCDSSSYYEVWVIKDPNAKVKPLKKQKNPNYKFWISTTLDEYRPGKNYQYTDTGKVLKDYWGSSSAIKFEDISKTGDILGFLPSGSSDPYYDRWLVWNRIARRYDSLRPAQY